MSSIFTRWLFRKTKHNLRFMCECKKTSSPTYGTTMNDLPSPSGNWQEMHSANQKKYALHLVLGLGSLMGSIAFGFANNLFESFSDIPETPLEIDCYKMDVEEEAESPPEEKKKK